MLYFIPAVVGWNIAPPIHYIWIIFFKSWFWECESRIMILKAKDNGTYKLTSQNINIECWYIRGILDVCRFADFNVRKYHYFILPDFTHNTGYRILPSYSCILIVLHCNNLKIWSKKRKSTAYLSYVHNNQASPYTSQKHWQTLFMNSFTF